MGSQSPWGLTLPLSGLPLASQQDLVTGLPELGYTDVWSAELNGIDGQVIYSRDESENTFQRVLIGDSSACYDSLRPQV